MYTFVCVCVFFYKSLSTTEREAAEEHSFSSLSKNECPSTPDIVKVVLCGHEGVEADQPFSLLSAQTVSCYNACSLRAGLSIYSHVHVCDEYSHWVLALASGRLNIHTGSWLQPVGG